MNTEDITDISIDLETLGTRPGCPILSIGLAGFNYRTGEVKSIGEIGPIDLHEQIAKYGLQPSGDTIRWWVTQKRSAKDGVFDGAELSVQAAISKLVDTLPMDDDVSHPRCPLRVWGNGATFDISILEAFYAECDVLFYGQHELFSHRNVRDMRTIMGLAGMSSKSIPFEGTPHTALDDATHQAKCIVAAMEKLGAA